MVLYAGKVKGFTAESKERQIPLQSVILDKMVAPATKAIQACLGLADGELVFSMKRLRYINDEPNTLVENYIPYKLCSGIESMHLENDSLYETLETHFHLVPHHARRIFESVRPSSREDIELLGLTPSASILAVESFVFMANGALLEYYTARVKGKYIVDV
jgi:GntR family transcriptional regulator